MPEIRLCEVEGKTINVDEEGYLVNFDDWSEEVACALADREGISSACPLTKERLEILKFLREYYKTFHAFPIVRAVCKKVHQPTECEYMQFPDPHIAWKLAGLPKLMPEVYAYIKHIKEKE